MNKKKSSIQSRAIKNSAVGFISFFVSLAQAFISVPILLTYWGNEIYAIWLALFAGAALFQSLDNGHINYVGNKINLLYNYDKEELKKTLSSSIIVAATLGLFQLIVILVLISFRLLPAFFNLSEELVSDISLSLSLLILVFSWFISGSYGGILHRLMIPAGFYTQSLWWGIIYKISQFASIVVVVVLGGNILTVCIFYSLIQIVVYLLTFIYIRIKIPEFYPWWFGGDIKSAFTNFRKSLLLTFNGIVQQLSNNGIILFISNMISSTVIPAFTTLRTITNTATSATNILISSFLPDIARFHTNQESKKLNAIFCSHWFFSGLIINIGMILILPFIESFFLIWTKGLIKFDYTLFLSLAVSISLINFGSGFYFYLTSINNLTAQSIITISRAVIIFGSGYLLVPKFGLSGIGIAIILSEVISSMILPFIFTKHILKSFNGKLDTKSMLTAALAPIGITCILVTDLLGVNFSLLVWFIALSLVLLIYVYNWFGLEEEVKMRFNHLFRNFMDTRE